MGFIQDYLLYNEGNECPREYHIWTALVLLASAAAKRVYIDYGYLEVYPNLYVTLVGKQGFRKSTAKDIGRDLFADACPDTPIGASVQSREDIIRFMSSPDCMRAMNIDGEPVEIRPIVFFINELKNWLSINPSAMVDFLTDIYDRKYFDSRTIKRNLEVIQNPCVNILACETPVWIIDKLKANIISGGFTRRMIYIYATVRGPKISFPTISTAAIEARKRCVEHLKKVTTYSGKLQWTPEGRMFFDKWYQNLKAPDDEVMAGFYESLHIQVLKVCIAMCLAETEPKLVLTKDLLEVSVALLDKAMETMPLLSVAAGRNELALPQQRILEVLNQNGGHMREKQLRLCIDKDLEPQEQLTLLNHLNNGLGLIKKLKVWRNNTPFDEIWLTEVFTSAIAKKHLVLEGSNVVWKGPA